MNGYLHVGVFSSWVNLNSLRLSVALVAAALLAACGGAVSAPGSDPMHASYGLGDWTVALVGGRAERPAAPDSAARERVSVWDEPVYGDLDGDGDEDAALLLIRDAGGSGTFYYLAAAIQENGRYRGTGAQLLGDRVRPSGLAIRHGIILADFAHRPEDAPMSAAADIPRTVWAALEEGELQSPVEMPAGAELMVGELVIGHEVREFRRCGSGSRVYWLSGDHAQLASLYARYRALSGAGAAPYTPLFAVVTGRGLPVREEGFGEGLHGLALEQVLRLSTEADCLDFD